MDLFGYPSDVQTGKEYCALYSSEEQRRNEATTMADNFAASFAATSCLPAASGG